MKRLMMAITAGLAGGLMLANLATAQDELEGREPQERIGDLGYQTYTVELPRKAWTIGMQLHAADGELSEQSITVLDGFVAEAMNSRSRGYKREDDSFGMAAAYGFMVWFVPDSKLEEWRAGGRERPYFDPAGQTLMSSPADATGPRDGVTVEPDFANDNGRRELLLANSQEITVDELHIFIYAPGYPRIDLSVDKVDYQHIINGVFRDDEDVLKAEDIPFELSKLETPSHIADIVLFTNGMDLGFITADGEQVPDDYWTAGE